METKITETMEGGRKQKSNRKSVEKSGLAEEENQKDEAEDVEMFE